MSIVETQRPELVSARLLATWNTGRGYTAAGQRIAVWDLELNDGRRALLMYDYDREVDYILFHEEFETDYDLRQHVMYSYDYHRNVSKDYDFRRFGRDVVRDHPVRTMQFRAFSF
jgi:hypothetical protein